MVAVTLAKNTDGSVSFSWIGRSKDCSFDWSTRLFVRLIDRSIDRTIDRAIDRLHDLLIEQTINQWIDWTIDPTFHRWNMDGSNDSTSLINETINKSIDRKIDRSNDRMIEWSNDRTNDRTLVSLQKAAPAFAALRNMIIFCSYQQTTRRTNSRSQIPETKKRKNLTGIHMDMRIDIHMTYT